MLRGTFTALVTPFKDDQSIDEPALRKLVDFQIENGVNGLVPMGTTGESPTVSHEENVRVIKIVVDQAKGRVPVIAGTGSNCTDEAIDLSKKALDLGVTACLQVAPYYNKPSQEGFLRHFTAIADKVNIPMIVYNIPSRTGKNVENSTMLKLAQHKNIRGVKEASGDFGQIMDLISKKPADFAVLSGDDNLTFPFIALGGDGVISVASNIVPKSMSGFVKTALAGDYENARRLHYELLPLFKVLFVDTNPIPIKAAMAIAGMMKEIYRLPMCPLSKENRETLIAALKKYDIG